MMQKKSGDGRAKSLPRQGLLGRVLITLAVLIVVGAAGALALVSSSGGGSGETGAASASATGGQAGSTKYGVPTDRNAVQGLTNPYKEDAAFLAAGEKLYKSSCVTCHGTKGELPMAHSFTVHSGHHSDGDYLWVLTFGLPGTPMTGQGRNLTLKERWQLVRFIRTKYLGSAEHNHP